MTFPTAAATITVRKFCGTAAAMCFSSPFVRRFPALLLCGMFTSIPQSRKRAGYCGAGPNFPVHPSTRLLQLLEDRRVLQGRHVLLDLLPLRDRAQQAPHDLA